MELTKFFEQAHNIRMFENDGVVSVVAADLTQMLGYQRTSDMLKLCKPKYIHLQQIAAPGQQRRNVNTITQHGVFEILAKTTQPIAERFQDWLYEEVLPAIAKNKAYVHSTATAADIDNALTPYQKLSQYLMYIGVEDHRAPLIQCALNWLVYNERYDCVKHRYHYLIDERRALELAATGEPPQPDTSDIDVYLTPPTNKLIKDSLDVDLGFEF